VRILSDRRYVLDVTPETVWTAMSDVDQYQRWWPWLARFDGTALETGQRWHCVVQPPLPYRVSFTVILEQVDTAVTAAATLRGDIVGEARIDLVGNGASSELRLRSSLAPSRPALQALAAVARPVVTFGHNWVLDTGARQFADRMRLDGSPRGSEE
jgi:hypothetical protein